MERKLSKKILILGGRGFLGSEISRFYKGAVSLSKEECDITNKEEVKLKIEEFCPEVIINAAAITDLKYCEENISDAWKINVMGVRNLSEISKKKGILLVHFSSNYALNPVNEYGRMKKASESLVDGLTIRSSFYNENHWIIKKLKNKEKVFLLKNHFFNPITVEGLLIVLDLLLKKSIRGIINVGTPKKISYFDFGKAICKLFKFNQSLLIPIEKIEVGYQIPLDAYLDTTYLKKLEIQIPSLEEDLINNLNLRKR